MLEAIFTKGVDEIEVSGLTQWDRGQKLNITADDLPSIYQVHFAFKGAKKALIVQVLNNEAAGIPDELLTQPRDLVAYVYFIGEDGSGETVRTINLPVTPREKPEDYTELPPSYQERVDAMLASIKADSDSAVATSRNALSVANEADSKSNSAVSTAQSAVSIAGSAVSTAQSAVSTAQNAVNTAQDALNRVQNHIDEIAPKLTVEEVREICEESTGENYYEKFMNGLTLGELWNLAKAYFGGRAAYLAFVANVNDETVAAALGKNNEDEATCLGRAFVMYSKYKGETLEFPNLLLDSTKADILSNRASLAELYGSEALVNMIFQNSYGKSAFGDILTDRSIVYVPNETGFADTVTDVIHVTADHISGVTPLILDYHLTVGAISTGHAKVMLNGVSVKEATTSTTLSGAVVVDLNACGITAPGNYNLVGSVLGHISGAEEVYSTAVYALISGK